MPQVVNGIGTWYHGKSNFSTRSGPCPYCGNHATLSSYDTRLWFVVFFIPIIPLGKKRIIDECAICRRHTAAPLHKWRAALQLDVSGAFASWREKPAAESASKAFGALIGYRQVREAGEFADEVMVKLPGEYALHAAMAGALAEAGDNLR